MQKVEKEALDEAVKVIAANPKEGQMKSGDLAGVQVFKYKHNTQQYLLAYIYVEERLMLTFIGYGSHENFYRDLKR